MTIQGNNGTLSDLVIHNRFSDALPGDSETSNQRRQVYEACYSLVKPQSFTNPTLVSWSRELAETLELDASALSEQELANVFSGKTLLPGMQPYAMCYGGHQFGNWAGQLGDGRAINLGEIETSNGDHWVLQLKGAGPTPYSRTADGLAVMRSSVREYLCSEAMFHLGVPTTRALTLVNTGEQVVRDMFYDGNPKPEPGAIVCRVAPSFLRFGSFEIFTSRQDHDNLRLLADFCITRDFPHLGKPDQQVYEQWFREICTTTATMIVEWMRVGFVHGVMNTDNMSILGLTIDYGPYGWLENYDPGWTPNTTDANGKRYRFGQQPQIALWNLVQLANAIYPLIEDVKILEAALEQYKSVYEQAYQAMMLNKLGLSSKQDKDESLIENLLSGFNDIETDMTLFFRTLAEIDETKSVDENFTLFSHCFYEDSPETGSSEALQTWLTAYLRRLQQEQRPRDKRTQAMNKVNPLYVLRNYLAQLAIDDAEQGNYEKLHELETVLKTPYTKQAGKDHLAEKRPQWARHRAGCSMLSCSS